MTSISPKQRDNKLDALDTQVSGAFLFIRTQSNQLKRTGIDSAYSPVMTAHAHLHLALHDSTGDAFLIMSIRDAIAREVSEFIDLVPAKVDAVNLLMGAIDMGFEMHRIREEKCLNLQGRAA